jgi:hypothetical protein
VADLSGEIKLPAIDEARRYETTRKLRAELVPNAGGRAAAHGERLIVIDDEPPRIAFDVAEPIEISELGLLELRLNIDDEGGVKWVEVGLPDDGEPRDLLQAPPPVKARFENVVDAKGHDGRREEWFVRAPIKKLFPEGLAPGHAAWLRIRAVDVAGNVPSAMDFRVIIPPPPKPGEKKEVRLAYGRVLLRGEPVAGAVVTLKVDNSDKILTCVADGSGFIEAAVRTGAVCSIQSVKDGRGRPFIVSEDINPWTISDTERVKSAKNARRIVVKPAK